MPVCAHYQQVDLAGCDELRQELSDLSTRRRPDFLSLDKSAAIPSECSNLTIYAGYLDHGRILIAKQPDIAGVHCKDSTIPSFISDIYFVQTSCGAAMD